MDNWRAWGADAKGGNPFAGLGVGRAETPRSEADVAVPLKSMVGSGGAGDWHPTVVNLAILILLEMAAYCALRYAFKSAHGG